MIQTGKITGGYLVKSEMNKGGMGTLYYAIDTQLNREVTLKAIHPRFSKNAELIKKFKNEAVTQAQMNHPNIITLYTFVHLNEDCFIVMEYVKGINLRDLLKKRRHLPASEAVFLMKQILRGLNYAHRRHIIHGDIKPGNILITPDKHVKIMDFGIAKIFGSIAKNDGSMLLGTPAYASPEQILGKGLDNRSDLYSVGITFYEMVTGKIPFDSDSGLSIDIEKAHLFESPSKPSAHQAETKPEMDHFILKAIQKKPEARFQSAIEMLEAIDQLTD